MRSLSLLVLLLFVEAECWEDWAVKMKQVVGDGSPRRLRSYNGLYLTDDRPAIKERTLWAMPKQDWLQDWTIVQINSNEVAFKSSRGFFLGLGKSGHARESQSNETPNEWQSFTPTKNYEDGSWSFKSRGRKWLSAHEIYQDYDPKRNYVNFQPENMACEHWWFEPYTPPATPTLIGELLANGGKYQFKSFNALYLTEDYPDTAYPYALDQRAWMEPQHWTIERMNNNEVAIKSHRNLYIGHGSGSWAIEAATPGEWEMLIPVKNTDGTWSFKSRENKWLSGHSKGKPKEGETNRYYVNFEKKNDWCEHWKLELV